MWCNKIVVRGVRAHSLHALIETKGAEDARSSVAPDGKTLATGSVKLWDITTGKELATLKGHTDGVPSVAFAPDGKTLATGGWDQTVKLWDITIGKELAALQGHSDDVPSVTFAQPLRHGHSQAREANGWTRDLSGAVRSRVREELVREGFADCRWD
jgi:WD40 repeat protein